MHTFSSPFINIKSLILLHNITIYGLNQRKRLWKLASHHRILLSTHMLLFDHATTTSFVKDLISPLLHILSPSSIRLAALQLLSNKEKNDLSQLVSTRVSYAITYKKMKSDMMPNTLTYEAGSGAGS